MGRVVGLVLAVAGALLGSATVLIAGSMAGSLVRAGVLRDDFGPVVLAGVALLAFIPVAIAVALLTGGWALWRRRPSSGEGARS